MVAKAAEPPKKKKKKAAPARGAASRKRRNSISLLDIGGVIAAYDAVVGLPGGKLNDTANGIRGALASVNRPLGVADKGAVEALAIIIEMRLLGTLLNEIAPAKGINVTRGLRIRTY